MEARRNARERQFDRRRAALATIPLLSIGAFNAGLVVLWGSNYLWGFVVLVPVWFLAGVAWIAFRERP